MSQHWHGHWTEESFRPKRLGNWEVPKWYPSWPDRHCITTVVEADDNGHLTSKTMSKHSPWGDFKGTWDLPKKITRQLAEELSATPQYKKTAWKLHQEKNQKICLARARSGKEHRKGVQDSKQQENEGKANASTDITKSIDIKF